MSENATQPDLVYALTCPPRQGASAQSRICFAARGTGLYRSDDGGETWRYCYDALNLAEPLPTTSVVAAPVATGAGDASSQPLELFAGVPGGVLHSTDGGETWVARILDNPPPAVSALVVSPAYREDGVLLAATTEDGIFRSANRGAHWSRWNFGLLDLDVYCMAMSPGFADDETLFVGVETGVFRSTNGGRAWREIDLPVGYEPVISLALSPRYPSDGAIFVGTEAHGLFFSPDDGATWTRLGADPIVDPVNTILLSPAYPEQPDLLVLTEVALWLSRDGGETWGKLQPVADGMTSVLAPDGLAPGASLMVGLVDGSIISTVLGF